MLIVVEQNHCTMYMLWLFKHLLADLVFRDQFLDVYFFGKLCAVTDTVRIIQFEHNENSDITL